MAEEGLQQSTSVVPMETGIEPRQVSLSQSQADDLLKQVRRHYDEGLEGRSDWSQRREERYRRYLADPTLRPEGPWPDSPRLFIAQTRVVLERLQAEFWQALFGAPNGIQLVPFGEEDVESASLATEFHNFTLSKPLLDFRHIANMAIFEALLDSAAILRIYPWAPPWRTPSSSGGKFFDYIARIDLIDQEYFITPPGAQGLQYPDAEYIAQEFFLRPDDLIRMRRNQRSFSRMVNLPDADDLLTNMELTERQRLEQEREGITVSIPPEGIRFVESYERFPIEGDEEEDVIVSWFPDSPAGDGTANKMGRIVRVMPLDEVFPSQDRPRRPYQEITVWPQPRQWRGMNVPDRLQSQQDMLNRLHEQMVNYGDVSLLPFYFYNAILTGDVPDIRQVRPGEGVPVADVSGIQLVQGRSLNRHFFEQIQLQQSQIERDSSVGDFQSGRTPDRPNAPRTASATLALLQESRRAFAFQTQHLAAQFETALSFHFQIWQRVLPPDIRVPLSELARPPQDGSAPDVSALNLADRLLAPQGSGLSLASSISKDQISGIYDVRLQIRPDAASDQEALFQVSQVLGPILQTSYPMGLREIWDRMFSILRQKGFDQIWPKEIAELQTRIAVLSMQLQEMGLQAQLAQLMSPPPPSAEGGDMGGGVALPSGIQPAPIQAPAIDPAQLAMLAAANGSLTPPSEEDQRRIAGAAI